MTPPAARFWGIRGVCGVHSAPHHPEHTARGYRPHTEDTKHPKSRITHRAPPPPMVHGRS